MKVAGTNIEELVGKARTLIEALPYMRAFRGETIVIKYGGAAMVNEDLKESFARDISLLKHIGVHPVVVHGGGPQIGATLDRMNIKTSFVEGMRVTDHEAIDVVEMVLVGKVNKEIVAAMNRYGVKAVGLSGKDAGFLTAEKMTVTVKGPEVDRPEIIDIGQVGKVTRVDASVLFALEKAGFVPVIAPVGAGPSGETFNINADFVAGEVAAAVGAAKLLLLTDESGILNDDGDLISSVTREEVDALIAAGVIRGGMLPKVEACFTALDGGVAKTHIIDGRISHSALLEIFTDTGVGSEIRGSGAPPQTGEE